MILPPTAQIVVAYIIGTITALVVAADKRTKTYRMHTDNLAKYTQKHSIPSELHSSMQEHLLMHLDFADRWAPWIITNVC